MGTGEDRVKPEDVEREIGEIRSRMGPVLEELARRRRRATDWKHQLRHRRARVGKSAALIGGLIAAVRFLKRRREHVGAPAY
jgi:hypothetical protein